MGTIRNGELYSLNPGKQLKTNSQFLDSSFEFVNPDAVFTALVRKVRLSDQAPNSKAVAKTWYRTLAYPPSCRLRFRLTAGYFWGNRGPDPAWGIHRTALTELAAKFVPEGQEIPELDGGFTLWPMPDSKPGSEPRIVFSEPGRGRMSFAEYDTFCQLFTAYWDQRAAAEPKIAKNMGLLEFNAGDDIAQQPMPMPPGAHFDFLPIAENRLLFFLVWQNQIRVWEEDCRDWDAEHDATNRTSKKPIYTIPADWAEPFVVYGSPPHFLFVTEYGRLYGWHAVGQSRQKMQQHWQGAPPIRALITDYDTGKTWAFAKPDPGTPKADPVYCLLDAETGIKNNAWKRYEFAEANGEGLPSAVTKLLPYVKVLQDNGDIRLPKTVEAK